MFLPRSSPTSTGPTAFTMAERQFRPEGTGEAVYKVSFAHVRIAR